MYNNYGTMNSANTLPVNDSSEKVQIFISARNLLDLDFFSKSDPYVKVFFRRGPNQQQAFLGKTQTIDNNLNPNFAKSFVFEYIFQAKQEVRFQVFDEDEGNNDDFIGQVRTTLGALAGAKNQTSFLNLEYRDKKKGGKSPGKLIVRLQPCSNSNVFFQMKWRAHKLMNTDSFFDFWDKSDPYLKFLKIRTDNTFIEAGRTQTIMDNLNPSWKPIQISAGKLFKDGDQGKFKIQCWDWEQQGQHKHQFIGQLFLNTEDIKKITHYPAQFPLFNRKHKKPGKLLLEKFHPFIRPSFVDFLRGGLELNLSIAIDFTASNGMPSHPTSLHHINPQRPNQYQIAIDAVSRILLNYDTDQRIPALGFGGKPHFQYLNSNTANHCFPLSGDPNQVDAFGLEHLMGLYNKSLTCVELAGPTHFSPIIREAMNIANTNSLEGSNTYQILLILTDGQIHDMDSTINLLVDNCNLPLSIIIVGVGNAQFKNMERLDGDNGLYNHKGKKAMRDIVQFVPFREVGMNPDLLAQQLLAELPGQVTQYMNMIGKPPGKPIHVNIDNALEKQGVMGQQQAVKKQVANMFQEANFFNGF